MPLVKNARITNDPFVHVADGAELPGDGDILVSAQRFLADPDALLRRPGKTGVAWPKIVGPLLAICPNGVAPTVKLGAAGCG